MKNIRLNAIALSTYVVFGISVVAITSAVATAQECTQSNSTMLAKADYHAPHAGSHSVAVTMGVSQPVRMTEELTNRLRKSKALGLSEKLYLKRQISGLFEDFSRYHGGENSVTEERLRSRYESILKKALKRLRKRDSELHRDLVTCKDDIWQWLSDSRVFNDIKAGISI